MSPHNCVIAVPVQGHIEPRCENGLKELERLGYPVWRIEGYAAIDQGRNQMASDALRRGYTETMWIDADIEFSANDVDKLRAHGYPITAGIYWKKGRRVLAAHVLPGTEKIVFGKQGGPIELLYTATGFLHVRSEAYQEIQKQLRLPNCNARFGNSVVPYFQPLVIPDGSHGHWYLAEDFAFCERARQCGFKIIADTTIRLRHIGKYGYSWEDAGTDANRFETYTFNLS